MVGIAPSTVIPETVTIRSSRGKVVKLYHGTSEKYLEAVLRGGLLPRRKRKGNWVHSVGSNPNAVYLTSTYSIFYAQCATESNDEKLAVIEIDTTLLDEALFAPDEDMLEQCSRQDSGLPCFGLSMKKRNVWFRKRLHSDFQHLWEKSLEVMGVCTYFGEVPPFAMTRVAVMPFEHPIRWASDPIVCPQNYAFTAGYYRNLTKLLFGDSDFENSILWSFADGIKPMPHREGVEVRVLK